MTSYNKNKILCRIFGHEPRRDDIEWINYGIYQAIFHCKRCHKEVFRIEHTLYVDKQLHEHSLIQPCKVTEMYGRTIFLEDEWEKIHRTFRN